MLGSLSQKSKQKSKRKYSKNTQSTNRRGRTFTHVTTEERLRIIELRGQGFTTRPIAEELGRSTRTINIVLKEQGLNGRIAKKGVAFFDQFGILVQQRADTLYENRSKFFVKGHIKCRLEIWGTNWRRSHSFLCNPSVQALLLQNNINGPR